MKYELKLGDNAETLKQYPDNYFDSIVTDPPYGIAFLGKDWDNNTGAMETWEECYRVLKPGGHLLAFSAARTYHHLATNIEMAGFEIRDQLMWLYASGFPKAQDIGKAIDKREGKKDPNYGSNKHSGIVTEGDGRKDYRCSVCNKTIGSWVKDCKEEDCGQKYNYQTDLAQQWSGWKTALKPAHEPIVMARKPFSGSTIDNVLTHGTGALNIDASRIAYADENKPKAGNRTSSFHQATGEGETSSGGDGSGGWNADAVGRFPSNVLGEVEGYQKFFYCPKVSRAERHVGFEKMPEPLFGDVKGCYDDGKRFAAKHQEYQQTGTLKRMKDAYAKANQRPRGEAFGDGNVLKDATETSGNNHPTVKPVELMKYLVRLVTPKGGKVLDPFNGSGSTGMACVELGYEYTGCELDPEYIEIANKRISAWENKHKGFVDLFEED